MSKEQFLSENLRDGEQYIGLLLGVDGAPDEHVFLMPDEAEGVTWDQAKAWAEKAGGRLPTRREQSLLIANAKAAFKPNWYWSDEQPAGDSDYAWFQYFNYGHQGYGLKSFAGRARAVRSSVI